MVNASWTNAQLAIWLLLVSYGVINGTDEFLLTVKKWQLMLSVLMLLESILFNPFDITLIKPLSNTLPNVNNTIRNFYSSYTKYVLVYNNLTYDIVSYTEPDSSNLIKLKVKG